MANLTSKELSALEDQLGFEKVLCCKYQAAEQWPTFFVSLSCWKC